MKRICLLFAVSVLALFSCEDSTGPLPGPTNPFEDFSWSHIALEDTLVFDLHYSSSGNVYAFTGLEVYYSETDSELDFTEITSLRNRTGFLAEPETNWLVSIEDSSVVYGKDPAGSFNEFNLSGVDIHSALLDGNILYTSNGNVITSLDLQTEEQQTLYSSEASEGIRLIAKVGDELYLKKGSQVVRMDLNSLDFTVTSLPTVNINDVISVNNGALLLASTHNQKVLISDNGGSAWVEHGPESIPANPVTDMLITDEDQLYISFLGSGVFVSTDLGESWTSQTNDQLDWNTYSVNYIPDIGLIAATSTGIYLRDLEE